MTEEIPAGSPIRTPRETGRGPGASPPDLRIALDRRLDQVFQEFFTGVFAGARRSLHDHRRVQFGSRFHDGLDLLQIVDV